MGAGDLNQVLKLAEQAPYPRGICPKPLVPSCLILLPCEAPLSCLPDTPNNYPGSRGQLRHDTSYPGDSKGLGSCVKTQSVMSEWLENREWVLVWKGPPELRLSLNLAPGEPSFRIKQQRLGKCLVSRSICFANTGA